MNASGCWDCARVFCADAGETVTGVMPDNESCYWYWSHTLEAAPGPGVKHRFALLYRLQTNGKVERVNRTLAKEWAYAVADKSEKPGPKAMAPSCITTITTDPTLAPAGSRPQIVFTTPPGTLTKNYS